jgi:hypothetical protein
LEIEKDLILEEARKKAEAKAAAKKGKKGLK